DAVNSGDACAAGHLALRVVAFLGLRGYQRERQEILRTALPVVRAKGSDELRARLLSALATACIQHGRTDAGLTAATEQLDIARRLDQPYWQINARIAAGLAHRAAGRIHDATEWFEHAIDAARATGQTGQLARALASRCFVELDKGNHDEAARSGEQALATVRNIDNNAQMLLWIMHLHGRALIRAGRRDEGERLLRQAAEHSETINFHAMTAYIQLMQADADILAGRWSAAVERLGAAGEHFQTHGKDEGIAHVCTARADIALCRGRPADAVDPAGQAVSSWRAIGLPLEEARGLARLHLALQQIGETTAAADCHHRCRTILDRLQLNDASLLLPPALAELVLADRERAAAPSTGGHPPTSYRGAPRC
ncbi:MAG: hypothetical protein ACRDJ9_34165, partial [Dehalococcoidia bacterium]